MLKSPGHEPVIHYQVPSKAGAMREGGGTVSALEDIEMGNRHWPGLQFNIV